MEKLKKGVVKFSGAMLLRNTLYTDFMK